MNIGNYHNSKFLLFLLIPLCVILGIIIFLYQNNALSESQYPLVQKELFFYINEKLSIYPRFQYNLTQMGDALVFLSILAFFFVLKPKLWEALIVASLLSLVVSAGIKNTLDVYRPASVFDNNAFTIIGERAIGSSSCPSGHSITVFTTLTVLMFFFMPKKLLCRLVWNITLPLLGFVFAFSRVAVGAHYPLDVILGCSLGFGCAVLGLYLADKFRLFRFISSKKMKLPLLLLFVVCVGVFVQKISEENIVIYYFPLLSLVVAIVLVFKSYFYEKQ